MTGSSGKPNSDQGPGEQLAIESLPQLVDHLEVIGVRFLELSGRRVWDRPKGFGTESDISLSVRKRPSSLGVRFKMEVEHRKADYAVEVEARFRADQPLDYSEELAAQFIERVAIMTAFPFLREAVATLAARLAVSVPVLGLIRAGQFQITPPEPSDP